MEKVYFENIKNIGDLYLDFVLNEYENEPILFTLKSDFGDLYFCLCSEIRNEYRWLLAQTNTENLEKLLNKQIDIHDILCANEKVLLITCGDDDNIRNKEILVSEIDELDIPEKGVFLRCNEDLFCEYISRTKNSIEHENNVRKISIHFVYAPIDYTSFSLFGDEINIPNKRKDSIADVSLEDLAA